MLLLANLIEAYYDNRYESSSNTLRLEEDIFTYLINNYVFPPDQSVANTDFTKFEEACGQLTPDPGCGLGPVSFNCCHYIENILWQFYSSVQGTCPRGEL